MVIKNTRVSENYFRFSLLMIALLCSACINIAPIESPIEELPVATAIPEQAFLNIILEQPESVQAAEAHYQLGSIALKDNRRSEAVIHFTRASENDSATPWNLIASMELIALSESISPDSLVSMEIDMAELNNLDSVEQPLIQRAEHLLANSLYRCNEWEKLNKLLDKDPVLQSDVPAIDNYQMMKGIALSRLGFDHQALETLAPLIQSTSPDVIDGILEYLDVLTKLGRFNEALQTTLEQPDRIGDPRMATRLAKQLRIISDSTRLEYLSEKYQTGIRAFLIRKELINRLLDQGLFPEAAVTISELSLLYPEFSNDLTDIQNSLFQGLQTKPEAIGLLIPLSGNIASIGYSILRGAQLAFADYELNGGTIPFTLHVIDSGDTRESVTAAFRELITEYKVIAVIGPVQSYLTETLLPLCSHYRTVLITPGTPKEGIVSASNWAFRIYPSVLREIETLIRFSVRELGIYRFGCLYPDNEFGFDAFRAIETSTQNENADLCFSRKYQRDLKTIRSALASLTDSAADVIIIPDSAERAAVIAGQIRFQEILTPTIAGIGAWEAADLIEIAGDNLNSSYFAVSHPFLHGPRKIIAERYETKFGESPDAFALRSYESIHLIMSAVERGIQNSPHLRNWLVTPSGLPGLDGITRFSDQGEYLTPVTIYRVRGSSCEPWRIVPVAVEIDNQTINAAAEHQIGPSYPQSDPVPSQSDPYPNQHQ
ncbi:ABC transporter substrate-binding protein [bacterium]|nr:ABC transporter substrate-binding protein [candidate division CSSED10-310 bacterium]